MVNAPMPSRPAPHPPQDNNQPQATNPNHPSMVALRSIAQVFNRNSPAQLRYDAHQNRDTVVSEFKTGWNHPMGKGFNPFRVIGQTTHQAASMFNPTTRAGLANVASLFAGGPKDPLGRDEMLMNKGFQPYNITKAADSGKLKTMDGHFNTRVQGKGVGIRGLVRRAEGVGGYKQVDPGLAEMARLEALRNEQSKLDDTRDRLKEGSNRMGFAKQQVRTDMRMQDAAEQKLGAKLIPYRYTSANAPQFKEGQGADFADRLTLLNLARNNPENTLLPGPQGQTALMQVLHDILFGNFKGPRPRFPGGA